MQIILIPITDCKLLTTNYLLSIMYFTTKEYWDTQYKQGKTGWNIGVASPPLTEYIDQLTDKTLKILIPGAGNAYEAEYLYHSGFKNVYLLDIAIQPLQNFSQRNPDFPKSQILHENFFDHQNSYDLIVEQTFFSALPPTLREDYSEKMFNLLKINGKLIGVLFQIDFGNPFPPFGGSAPEYIALFSNKFHIRTLETATNSIKPRLGNELFFIFQKK